MGRGARNIGVGLLLAVALVVSVSAAAGASETKVRAPRIGRLAVTASGLNVRLAASINPERLQSSYALELVYHAPGCCPPGSKECCKETPETEVVSHGTLVGDATSHEVHASATLRSGNDSVRFRVEAANRVGSSEKSHKVS